MVVHCKSEQQAQFVRDAIAKRLAQCGLELHPDKTRIVYCKDADRRGYHEHERFDFLGYTFRPRLVEERSRQATSSTSVPAVSDDAVEGDGSQIRSWRINLRSDKSLDDLARDVQQGRARLDQLLRTLLQVQVVFRLSDASTTISCDGPSGNTSGCAATPGGRDGAGERRETRTELFAHWRLVRPEAGHWEPGEPRGSRPVLREPGAQLPPADSHLDTSGGVLSRAAQAIVVIDGQGLKVSWESPAGAGRC